MTVAFVQEYRSEQSLQALNQLVPHHCRVKRDNSVFDKFPAANLVPGDLILLRTGDRIPADVRLVEAVHLELDESNLTGESDPLPTHAEPIPVRPGATVLPITERTNIGFMGSLVR